MATSREKSLLETCKAHIDQFQTSKAAFRLIASVNSRPGPPTNKDPPKTLFILDSSYNPPSRAHESLAVSAAHATASPSSLVQTSGTRSKTKTGNWKYPGPSRILLLFSTANADKAAKPAAFEHRLAAMVLLAEDLASRLTKDWPAEQDHEKSDSPPAIDIGLTTEPIYHAKSTAICAAASTSATDTSMTEDSTTPAPNGHIPVNSSLYARAQHIHLVGYDTIIRIFNAKYYKGHDPPLSALNSYFDKHGFRVTVRPEGKAGEEEELQAQLRWVDENIASGRLEGDGARKEWADRVEMVRAHDGDVGEVSSTKIREAAVKDDEEALRELCSPRVARWIRDFGLYRDEETD